ncbi:MAG: hypothetical protein M3O74_13835 [Pseudomonadota bacterium]|nr:hypothetical protein [Pseudomonadota bacterium]
MQATKTTARRSNKSLKLNTATAVDTMMDPEIASLLSVLDVPLAAAAPVEIVEENMPPIEVSGEVIESASVELLDGDLSTDQQAVIKLTPEILAGGEADATLEAAVAGLEVAEHYALVPPTETHIESLTDEEAEKERLLAEEALATEMSAVEPGAEPGATAPKATRAPRVHYQNKTDRIKARLGSNLGNYLVLEIADAELEGDALKAKQDETLAVIDSMSVKVKNRASLLLDWLSGKTGKPNEILKRALDVLAADGKITTGDNGNLHKNLIAKPYSPSAARAMGRNTVTVMEKTKMIVAGAKGEYLPNSGSLFLLMAQQNLNPAAVEPAVEEPAAAVEAPAAE